MALWGNREGFQVQKGWKGRWMNDNERMRKWGSRDPYSQNDFRNTFKHFSGKALILSVVSVSPVSHPASLSLPGWTLITLMCLTCIQLSPGIFKPASPSILCYKVVAMAPSFSLVFSFVHFVGWYQFGIFLLTRSAVLDFSACLVRTLLINFSAVWASHCLFLIRSCSLMQTPTDLEITAANIFCTI